MDDAVLVREFQRTHDQTHFNALVERHRGPVFRLVLSILGPGREGEAEELAQDVFVKVYKKLDGFRGEAKFSSWLFRIAYNAALDHRARLSFRATHQSQEVLEMTPSESREANPFQIAVDESHKSAIKVAMAKLPDLYRSVLHLHYWMGMTVGEVSETLAIPDGTVKSYMHRARRKLHEMLSKQGVTDV
jgi:RNA polymerase sigma-70 factor (ECF subfamily)